MYATRRACQRSRRCLPEAEQRWPAAHTRGRLRVVTRYSVSASEPSARLRKWAKSLRPCRLDPSAILDGTDTAARRSCETRPKRSLAGRVAVVGYSLSTRAWLRCQTLRSRNRCMFLRMAEGGLRGVLLGARRRAPMTGERSGGRHAADGPEGLSTGNRHQTTDFSHPGRLH